MVSATADGNWPSSARSCEGIGHGADGSTALQRRGFTTNRGGSDMTARRTVPIDDDALRPRGLVCVSRRSRHGAQRKADRAAGKTVQRASRGTRHPRCATDESRRNGAEDIL